MLYRLLRELLYRTKEILWPRWVLLDSGCWFLEHPRPKDIAAPMELTRHRPTIMTRWPTVVQRERGAANATPETMRQSDDSPAG